MEIHILKESIFYSKIMEQITFSMLNDVWMDNGLETLYSILTEAEDESFKVEIKDNSMTIIINDFDEFKKKMGNALEQRRSHLIVSEKDKKDGTRKEIKKDYVLIQEDAKIEGKVAFKEALYNKKTAVDTTTKIIDLMVGNGQKTCVVCGQSFTKPAKKLQQAAYPFVTKIKSLSGIRSYKNEDGCTLQEYYDDFCATCYLRGITEWTDDAIIYRTVPGEKSTLFLPQSTNLKKLISFKNLCRKHLNRAERYQNIKEEINSDKTEKTSGTFGALLCFYDKFFIDIQKKEDLNKTWAIMEIPFGAVKNIKFHELTIKESILDIMWQLHTKGIYIYSSIIKSIYFFSNQSSQQFGWKLTEQIREDLSKAFIRNDFRVFASSFLPQKGGRLGFSNETRENFEIFLYKWRFENMGLSEESFEVLKSAGKMIAVASRSHQSLLYKVDKAKDKSALLDALRQVSRRIVGLKQYEKEKYKKYILPQAIEDLTVLVEKHSADRKFVEDLRNILVIFSCIELSKLIYIEEQR